MIIGDYFQGDDNQYVQDLQHDYYGKALVKIFKWCRHRYISSVRDLDLPTVIQNKVSCMNGFDHRTLQLFHDFIAASFRYYNAKELEPVIPFPGEDEAKRVIKLWSCYLEEELQRLSDTHNGLVRSVIEAVSCPNPNPIGIKAEDRLAYIMVNDSRYDFLNSEWKKIEAPYI